MQDETALISGLRAGDEAAADCLVRSYRAPLQSMVRRYLSLDADVEDVIQDTFLSALRAIHRFDGRSSLSTWLHRIAINKALMLLRVRRRRPEISLDHLVDGLGRPAPDWMTGPVTATVEARVVAASVSRWLHASIDELPTPYRAVLLLRDLDGLGTADTARVLSVTPNTVKMRLFRARRALRRLVAASQPTGGNATSPNTAGGNRIGASSRVN